MIIIGHLGMIYSPAVFLSSAVNIWRIAINQSIRMIESRDGIERRLTDDLHTTNAINYFRKMLYCRPPGVDITGHSAACSARCVAPRLPLATKGLPPSNEIAESHF
jgi:hypothetical protein